MTQPEADILEPVEFGLYWMLLHIPVVAFLIGLDVAGLADTVALVTKAIASMLLGGPVMFAIGLGRFLWLYWSHRKP